MLAAAVASECGLNFISVKVGISRPVYHIFYLQVLSNVKLFSVCSGPRTSV